MASLDYSGAGRDELLGAPTMGGTGTTGLPKTGYLQNRSYAGTEPGNVSFVPPETAGPFWDRIGLGTATASYGAGAMPGAASWQAQLFNPGFNPGEQAFMQSTGEQINRNVVQPGMNKLASQFSGTPFHSSYLNTSRELMENAGKDLGNVGLQAWQNRQGLAGNAAQRIMGSPLDAASQAQQGTSDLWNMTNSMFQSYFGAPLAIQGGSPIMQPTIVSGGGSGGGKK